MNAQNYDAETENLTEDFVKGKKLYCTITNTRRVDVVDADIRRARVRYLRGISPVFSWSFTFLRARFQHFYVRHFTETDALGTPRGHLTFVRAVHP